MELWEKLERIELLYLWTWYLPVQSHGLYVGSRSVAFNHYASRMTRKPLRIILADDDEDDRQLFIEAIAHIDALIEIQSTSNGAELLSLLDEGKKPDIIFLDLNMPGKTGKECLMEIRKSSQTSDIPIIIYSTSANRKDVLDTYTKGANLYMLKPSSFRELIILIKRALCYEWDDGSHLTQQEFVLSS